MTETDKQYPLQLRREYYVATANDLIKGKQKMSLREAQLLAIAISQIYIKDTELKTYTTTVPELADFMGIDENSLYRDLENICTSLLQRVVKIQTGGENARGQKKWKIFHWASSASYDSGKLTLRLSDDIKPYLLELKSYYSQTLLGTLMTFRSYYAVRLYQYLWADNGEQWGAVDEWHFTCEQLRELFQIGEKQYKLTRDLLRKTIIPALKELDESDFVYIWDYQEHHAETRGRPIESISFRAMFFVSKEKKEWFLKRGKALTDAAQKEQK